MREVLLIIWTLITDLESGMFNDGGGLMVGAMFELRKPMGPMRSIDGTAEDRNFAH